MTHFTGIFSTPETPVLRGFQKKVCDMTQWVCDITHFLRLFLASLKGSVGGKRIKVPKTPSSRDSGYATSRGIRNVR
ncbi:hypothetical protein [Methyloglobulus sp.]|uniref:hypothetical protein n=1 Tax=Methyloglobulus sp. TaxID=2518622 RepID=UPI003989F6AD